MTFQSIEVQRLDNKIDHIKSNESTEENIDSEFMKAADLLRYFYALQSSFRETDIFDESKLKTSLWDRIVALQMFDTNAKINIKNSNPINHELACLLKVKLMDAFSEYEKNDIPVKPSISIQYASLMYQSSQLQVSSKEAVEATTDSFKTVAMDYASNLVKIMRFLAEVNIKNAWIILLSVISIVMGISRMNLGEIHGIATLSSNSTLFFAGLCMLSLIVATIIFSVSTRLSVVIHHGIILLFCLFGYLNAPEIGLYFNKSNMIALSLILLGLTQLRYLIRYILTVKHIANAKKMITRIAS